ncbi:MAG TPA: antibiotic biosynthesis monooxygenase [Fimbriimonadaceae bacterium]|nr:antibiotic biosynthesis monooxygenase [Fimbriimonadaceae bacterium]
MLIKQSLLVGFGIAMGIGIGVSIPFANAQVKAQGQRTVGEFPDLVGGLRATPGCLSVKTSSFNAGKQAVIFSWFKNKAAVNAWYNSKMHRDAMRKFFPNHPGNPSALSGFKDEKSPLLVVASVTPSDKPMIAGSPLAVSQIAIEIYQPVPGGLTFGGGFAPDTLEVPGLIRMPANGGK